MVSSLSANVSHEMRAPLNCISSSIDLLIDNGLIQNPAAIKLLKPIKNASVVLNCQVNDLLDRNLIIKGHFTPNLKLFDVVEVVKEIEGILKPNFEIRKNTLELII